LTDIDPFREDYSMIATLQDAPELLTRAQAAEFLGIAAQTLACWATHKRYPLPYIKVGRSVRYSRDALAEFVRSRTVNA
jgi:excisionase family DNA binding protein